MTRRAIFVDRDGVINELVPDRATGLSESPLRPDDVALIPGAADAIRRFVDDGWLVIGVSNQPAAAKGILTVAELGAVQSRVIALLAERGATLHAFRTCLHHPDGTVPELSRSCVCRKPAPGMLLDAARACEIDLRASWMIGDTDADVLAGRAAGCHTVLVENPRSAHKRSGQVRGEAVAQTLCSVEVCAIAP